MAFVSGPAVLGGSIGNARVRRRGMSGRVVVMAAEGGKRVLLIGGTRFSGLYLAKELADRGHELVLFNRGNTAKDDPKLKVPGESDEDFAKRVEKTSVIVGDRTDGEDMVAKLKDESFDIVFDNNGRELDDSKPLIDLMNGKVQQYVYMSSAGVYKKSDIMPHIEGDEEDPKSRHKGKLNTEAYLKESGIPFTSIRPTYIYGALNYNPLEQWFFERLDAGRPVPVPGHGMHLTGLGHVRDLASAMASVIGNDKSIGQIYNIQDRKAISFDGMVKACAQAMGKDPDSVEIVHYNPKDFDFGKAKAFPMRPQHFFCSPDKALEELDWDIKFTTESGLADSYNNDFVHKKAAGGLKNNFTTDDMVLSK